MRSIKFRVWDTETMLYQDTENCSVFEVLEDGELCIGSETDSTYEGCPFSVVKGSALMQYTGLKDKNGVEIYEGDILKYSDGDTANVEWIDKFSGYYVVNSNYNYIARLIEWDNNSEIIGNIYENSNLLTE